MNSRSTLLLAATAILIAAGLAWAALRKPAQAPAAAQSAPASLVRLHSPVMGPADAPVTIVEFFDPACAGCRAYHPYVKQILAQHPREARLVLRYVPFHGAVSVVGVQVLEAARQQDLFEPVLDALFEGQEQWASHGAPAPERAWELARAAGLDVGRAREWVAGGAADRLLAIDVADAQATRIEATPTFFVNGKALAEPGPEALQRLVQGEVEAAAASP
jgi:protein-disulfide isomerase